MSRFAKLEHLLLILEVLQVIPFSPIMVFGPDFGGAVDLGSRRVPMSGLPRAQIMGD